MNARCLCRQRTASSTHGVLHGSSSQGRWRATSALWTRGSRDSWHWHTNCSLIACMILLHLRHIATVLSLFIPACSARQQLAASAKAYAATPSPYLNVRLCVTALPLSCPRLSFVRRCKDARLQVKEALLPPTLKGNAMPTKSWMPFSKVCAPCWWWGAGGCP
jgi:hypothetical protein